MSENMMKALVKYEPGKLKVKLKEMPVPEPGAGQVRIRTKAAGVCGTDLHIYFEDSYPTNPPVILGHELSGIIDKVGEGVTGIHENMRVTSETLFYTCGTCGYCRTGRDNLCMNKRTLGSGANGAFGDYLVVPARNIH
ncbi:MAG: alcohol dehydrogenase catalytic domain-containing protein, partial [Spirochaetales bacterium]|nr:alcohol dehydrogenase catalytic domain-containing protein [Spirochaetales bacterium]